MSKKHPSNKFRYNSSTHECFRGNHCSGDCEEIICISVSGVYTLCANLTVSSSELSFVADLLESLGQSQLVPEVWADDSFFCCFFSIELGYTSPKLPKLVLGNLKTR